MKKSILSLAAGLLIAASAMAQTGLYSTRTIAADGSSSEWSYLPPVVTETAKFKTGEEIIDNDIIYISSGGSKIQIKPEYLSCKETSSIYIPVPADAAGTLSMTTAGSSDGGYFQLFVNDVAAEKYLCSKLEEDFVYNDDGSIKKGPQAFDFTADGITTKDGKTYLHIKDNHAEMKIASFKVVLTAGSYAGGGTSALENVAAEVKATKVIENGQLVIIRDGVRYNALGAQL